MTETLEILDIIDKKLEPLELRCIDIRYSSPVLSIFIDFPLGGQQPENVAIQDCVRATKELRDWEQLDSWYGKSFELAVCSPGIEKPVVRIEDFKKHLGDYFKIKLKEKLDGQKNFQGELLEIEGSEASEAKLKIEFEEKVSVVPVRYIQQADCHIQKTTQSENIRG